MNIVHIETQSTHVPTRIGDTFNPDEATLLAAGWRYRPDLPPIAEGFERSGVEYVDAGDGRNARAVYTDTPIAERLASEQAAKLATFPKEKAAMFRSILRRHFGTEAETNRAVTVEAVTAYFATKPDVSAEDVRDGVLLRELHDELAMWNENGETWTLPWPLLSEEK